MPRKDRTPADRIYERNGRWYIDVRDLGAGREPLRAPGAELATTDRAEAEALALARVQVVARMARTGDGIPRTLEAYAAHYLDAKAKARKVSRRHLADLETRLQSAVDTFGASRELATIRPRDVRRWIEGLPSANLGTRRHYLNALSNLYRYAISDDVVPVGYNPAAAMVDKPSPRYVEPKWLEADQAALFLEAARRLPKHPKQAKAPDATLVYPLVAVCLLTGCRPGEALDLAVEDVSFERGMIRFRPHEWTRGKGTLKTKASTRTVPMWPQLREILEAYLNPLERAPGTLLFPSPRTPQGKQPKPLAHWRKTFKRLLASLDWTKADLDRAYVFRHTYIAHRLQTLDQGAPVATYTVAREVGTSVRMIDEHYGHLVRAGGRAEVVAFRVADHRERLRKPLEALGWHDVLDSAAAVSGTTTDTRPSESVFGA